MRLILSKRLLGIIIVLLALACLPYWASRYWVLVVLLFSLNLALAQMWNLLAGYSGLISLGQQAFVGLGGYTLAVFSMYYGFPIWLSILIGGFISVLFALLISPPIFRMRGVYFAIGTWTVAETLRILFSNWKYVGYGMGLFVNNVYGTTIVHHGGDMIGFHSDMIWLPEHGVGAVILTNGDPGWLIRTVFRRKLLEVLFDGNPEAASAAKSGKLVPSWAHEMAMPPANKGAMFDVVTAFINTPGMTPKQAAEKMAAAGKR